MVIAVYSLALIDDGLLAENWSVWTWAAMNWQQCPRRHSLCWRTCGSSRCKRTKSVKSKRVTLKVIHFSRVGIYVPLTEWQPVTEYPRFLFLVGLRGLDSLILAHNKLTKVPANVFSHLPFLNSLELEGNNIAYIDENAFAGLEGK